MTSGIDPDSDNDLVADGTTVRSQYDSLDKLADGESPGTDDLFTKGSSDAGWLGGTYLADSVSLADDLESGAWLQAALDLGGIGLSTAAAASDPIGFVAGQLIGWMLEHCEPLRGVFHALVGSPEMVKAYSDSWQNIERELSEVADDYASKSGSDTQRWLSGAGDAYRRKAADTVDLTKSAANAAAGMKSASAKMSEVVATIRSLVQDILSSLAGALVSYAIELAATLLTAAPVVAEQAMLKIAEAGGKVARLVEKLTEAVAGLGSLLGDLKTLLSGLLKEAQAG